MLRRFALSVLLLAMCGCGPAFKIRKESDLLRIDPKEARRLRDVRMDADYSARVTDRSIWQLHTTLAYRPALNDGDLKTVATSDDEHRQGDWILIDLGSVCHFQNVRQLHPPDGGEPARYRVDTAGDHGFPYTLQFVGPGQPGSSAATFPRPVDARFIRITVIDDSPSPWAVAEVEVY